MMATSAGSGVCNFVHSLESSMMRFPSGLRTEYQQRRDFFTDCLAEEFHLQAVPAIAGVWQGCIVYRASKKYGGSLVTVRFAVMLRTFFIVRCIIINERARSMQGLVKLT
ncbi:uncharacterized protein EDB91DRAFT_817512 [Suillus paluster]|uniref:uncharacterized protein n=1 Tax=Suillus paluster TaxID=48578 RepID=UPI001B87C5FE|nr:uncharacterized protein EDB91DRAFT_817512 [Suillus paluster]KAG1729218.1 hypothetical protein EDB91DRAFT_817512 [Suillus paluster]